MPICDRCGKLPKAERAGLGRVGTAGGAIYRRAENVRGRAISQDQQRKGTIAGPTKARMRFGGIKDCLTDKEAVMGGGGKEDIKGDHNWKVSVGLVRRRNAALVITPELLERAERGESQRPTGRTGIWGISKAVVGRAAGQDCWAGARRRHTEVRSSCHFRVRTEVNSTTREDLIFTELIWLPTYSD
ncbi:hypothetical protein BY996DRAFT_6558317 [Phakopsora pachyrhizi]|nr:hypothetical protein BY996DRAFT_6558317 [Phakopsora pachyrhizi]